MKANISYLIKLIGDDNNTKVLEPEQPFIIGKDNLTEQGRMEFDLLASADDVEQAFNQVDAANVLLIVTTEDIGVKLNANTADEILIVADKLSGNTKYGIMLGTFAEITKVFLTNKSTTSVAKIKMLYAS